MNSSHTWMNPAAILNNRWLKIDPKGREVFYSVLCHHLRDANCFKTIHWLYGSKVDELTPEENEGSVRAILRALDRAYDNPTESQAGMEAALRELRDLRRATAKALQMVLEHQEGNTWAGEDFDALPRIPQKQLLYMAVRESAELESLFQVVWEREYVAGRTDLSAALNKVNQFLFERQAPRSLHKRRGKPQIFWE